MSLVAIGAAAIIIFFVFVSGIRIVKEFERGVILRLGRYVETKGPGFKWIIPGVDKMYTIDTRVVARDVPPQDVITKDNVSVKVNAVIYFRVVDPDRSVLKVENYLYATSQYAQTTLRSILGQHELDELLTEREAINQSLQEVLDRHTDPWGVKVTSVELKHVDLPTEMQRAMARQAEAERERRAKIIAAQGEFQAAEKLAEAAEEISQAKGAMTLRYLQTLAEIGIQNNTTVLFPLPIDMLEGIQSWAAGGGGPTAKLAPRPAAKKAAPAARPAAPASRPAAPAAKSAAPAAPATSPRTPSATVPQKPVKQEPPTGA